MKRYFLLAAFILPALLLRAQYTEDNLDLNFSEARNDYTFKKLKLYPVYANSAFLIHHQSLGEYISLKEAINQKLVTITERESGSSEEPVQRHRIRRNRNDSDFGNENSNEVQEQVGDGATVNTLYIENNGQDTVFIMAGEIVKGGKQDRMIAQDIVLPPNSGQVDLSVFCVEHGRWHYGDSREFKGYSNSGSNSVRAAAVKGKNQGEVWGEVYKFNSTNGNETNTDAYTSVEDNEAFQTELKTYLSYFKDFADRGEPIIGMVGVTDDRIIGCDLFATPHLFRQQFSTLLHSYASEAITNGKLVSIKDGAVEKYMAELLVADEAEQEAVIRKKGASHRKGVVRTHISIF